MKKKGGRRPKPRKEESAVFRPLEAALRKKLEDEKAKALPAREEALAKQPPKALDSPAPSGADELSEADRALLQQFMAGTIPLDKKGARIPRTASSLEQRVLAPVAPGPDPDDEARARLRALVEGTSTFEVVDDGLRIQGRRADIDPRILRRLRNGLLPIDARLDLHGMSLEEAKRAVEGFIGASRRSHERVLLIIHGKGNHSLGGVGVLRGEIGAWLSSGPASCHVACFATARDEDGGNGAVYVLLRR